MTLQHEIVATARRWIGVPFCHQGRSRKGVDCLGLLVMIAHENALLFNGHGAHTHDATTYGHRPDTQLLMAGLCRHLHRIEAAAMQPGDIALMRVDHLPQHLAIISDYPEHGHVGMIHAYAPARKVVEHRLCEHWRTQLHAAFRLPHLS